MPLSEIAKFIAAILTQFNAPYVIIGGVAVIASGRRRTTADIDIVIAVRPKDVTKLLNSIEAADLPIYNRAFVEKKLKDGYLAKIQWKKRKYGIDLRLASWHLDQEAIRGAEILTVSGVELPVCPPEELIVYKLARFDEIDRGDIISILRVRGDELDWKHIETLAKDFNVERGDDKVYKNFLEIKSWIRPEE